MAGIGMIELLVIGIVGAVVVGGAAVVVASGRWTASRARWTLGGALVGGTVMWLAAMPLPGLQGSLATAGGVRFVAVVGAIAGTFIGWAWRPLSDDEARRWAAKRGVEDLGDGGVALLQRFVRASRGWRTLAVAGLLPLSVYAGEWGNALGGRDASTAEMAYAVGEWLGVPTAAVLYGIAALAVELRRRGAARGTAVLSARDVDDYVNPFARRLQRIVLALGLAGLVFWLASPGELGYLEATGLAVLAIGGVVTVEAAQRRVVARQQRYADPELVLADDLARSSTAHALTGAVVGAGAPIVALLLTDASASWEGAAYGVIAATAGLLSMVSIGLWAGLGTSYASTVTRPVARDRDAEVSA